MVVFLYVVVIVAVLFLILLTAIGCYFIRFMTKPTRQTPEHIMQVESENGVWKDLTGIKTEPFNVTATDGYLLHATLLYAPTGTPSPVEVTPADSRTSADTRIPGPVEGAGSSDTRDLSRWVIITHGYTNCRLGTYKYAHMFLKLGWNCCIWDLRHHGENEDCYCSMGYHEPKDIVTIAAALRGRFGPDISIGLHGESLGSASSVMALGLAGNAARIPEPVEGTVAPTEGTGQSTERATTSAFTFLISGCGFASLKGLMCYLAGHNYHLPSICAWAASTLNLLFHGYTFFSIQPVKALAHTPTPVLFIHGADDAFIPPCNAEQMYNALRSRPDAPKTDLYLCPGAQHALSYAVNPAEYEKRVAAFLSSID